MNSFGFLFALYNEYETPMYVKRLMNETERAHNILMNSKILSHKILFYELSIIYKEEKARFQRKKMIEMPDSLEITLKDIESRITESQIQYKETNGQKFLLISTGLTQLKDILIAVMKIKEYEHRMFLDFFIA